MNTPKPWRSTTLWDGSIDGDDPPEMEEPWRQYFDEVSGMATSQSAAPSSTDRRSVPGADAAQSDGSPPGVRTAGKLGSEFPDATGAGRGSGEELVVPPAMTPLGKSDAQPEQPLLDPLPGAGLVLDRLIGHDQKVREASQDRYWDFEQHRLINADGRQGSPTSGEGDDGSISQRVEVYGRSPVTR